MSRPRATNPLGLAAITVTDTTSRSDLFTPFFGEPPGGPIRTDPYERQANQNLALPDAFRGRSTYLGQAIEFQVRTEDDWYSLMLPITEPDTLSISWNKWTFDQHRTTRVPEEAPSRLITNRRSQTSRSMERQGIMFQLEHGFMKTQQGVDNYVYNLRQMAYAVSETNKQDVIMAYLNAKDVYTVWEKRHGHYNNRTIRQRLDMERDQWACVQKDEMGLAKLDAKSDEEFMKVHGRADTWILPPKMQLFAKFQPHETDYYLSGKTWSFDSKETFGTVGNKRAYLMRQYDIDVDGLQDISIRERQIGQYYTMVDRYSNARSDLDVYTNEERSIIVYDEDLDKWVKLTMDMGLEHCKLWDTDGKVQDVEPSDSDSYRNVAHQDDKRFDPFTMPADRSNENKRIPISFIGQLSEEHLKTSSLIGLARTAVKAMGFSSASLQEISDTIISVMDSNTRSLKLADVTDLFDTDEGLKDFDKTDVYMYMVPPGNQYQDFKAGLDDEQKRRAHLTPVTSYQRFIGSLRNIFSGSVFLDDKWAAPIASFMSQSNVSGRVILESLMGGFGLPVWIRKTPGATDASRLEMMDKDNLVSLRSLLPLAKNTIALRNAPDLSDDGDFRGLFAALEKLFGFKAEGDADDVGKFQAYQQATAAPAAALASGDPVTDAAIDIRGYQQIIKKIDNTFTMSGGATMAKFTLRERLIVLIQNLIIRLFSAKPNAGSARALTGIIIKMEELLGADAAAGANPIETYWKNIVTDVNVKTAFNTAFGGDGFPDTKSLQDAIVAAELQNIPIGGNIAAPFNVAQQDNAFYITPMYLTLPQLKSVLGELVGDSDTTNDYQKKLDKAKITVSIPSQLDRPIVSGADMKLLYNMLRDPKSDLVGAFSFDASDFGKSPLARFLSASMGRKRKADGAADDGGRYARQEEEEDDVRAVAGIRFQFPVGFEVPTLVHFRFLKRIQSIEQQMVNPLYKFVAKILAALPFTKQALSTLYQNNINIPLGFLVAGPHMRYHMHFAIKALAGSETGNTYIKDVNFEVGDDIHNKMHWGHLTLYSKAIVREDKNVRVFYDIFSGQCLGGAGTKVIDTHQDQYNPRDSLYGNGSLLFLAVGYEDQEFPNPLDISGHFTYFNDSSNTDRTSDSKPHYSTAFRYNKMYGWRLAEDINKFPVEQTFHPLIYQPQENRLPFNTVCYHGEEHYYNRNSRLFDIEHGNTGHWGPFCFPGARKLRDGDLNVWKQPARLLKI